MTNTKALGRGRRWWPLEEPAADLLFEILETLGLHGSRLKNRPMPFVLDGGNVKRWTPPLQDRFACGGREFQLVLGISLRQIDGLSSRAAQELHEKLGLEEIAFGGVSKGTRFLGIPGLGKHMRTPSDPGTA